MQVIALAGLAQCGKSTLAGWIAEGAYNLGLTPRKLSFAGSLKRAAVAVGADKKSNPELYRKFCQVVGGSFRDLDYVPGVTGPDYWVDLVRQELAQLQSDDDERIGTEKYRELVVIFDDARYMNELGMLRDWEATTIYVDRGDELPDPEAPFRKDISEKLAYDLETDFSMREELFQYTVTSDGTMDEYKARVQPFIPVWAGAATIKLPKPGQDHKAII